MKKILTLLYLTALLNSSHATDLLVVEGGAGGAYANIVDAVTAAVTGDRILITPKVGGATWNENITVTSKSLQFLSATEGTYWRLNGTLTFNPTAAGQSFAVVGAHITSGNIATGISAPSGVRAKVTIMGCKLDNGFINFDANYYDMNVAADSLMNGYIYFRYGKVLGNFIDVGNLCAHGINVSSDVGTTNNMVYIVGNKIDCSTNACTNYGIAWGSNAHFYNISNNYIKHTGASQNPIYVNNSKSSTLMKNQIMNNTIILINNANVGIYVTSFSSAVQVYSNVIQNTSGSVGYGFGSSTNTNMFEASYNYVSSNVVGQAFYVFTNDGTNQSGVVNTYDASTGEILTGPAVNGGSPDLQYSDLDLSRNDAGCFGGSFSRENFLTGTLNAAQVTFFDAPNRILTGNSIDIAGEGFDK